MKGDVVLPRPGMGKHYKYELFKKGAYTVPDEAKAQRWQVHT